MQKDVTLKSINENSIQPDKYEDELYLYNMCVRLSGNKIKYGITNGNQCVICII